MNAKSSTPKRAAILGAAGRLVLGSGVATLTLEAVAREAGVSKGGLLYHFPTKEALIAAMVEQLIADFDSAIEAELARDGSPGDQPGRWLRAYLRATLSAMPEPLAANAALLAAVATNPALLAPLRAAFARWQRQAEQDGLAPAWATAIRLAADGLWFAELLDLAPLDAALRGELFSTLTEMTQETP